MANSASTTKSDGPFDLDSEIGKKYLQFKRQVEWAGWEHPETRRTFAKLFISRAEGESNG